MCSGDTLLLMVLVLRQEVVVVSLLLVVLMVLLLLLVLVLLVLLLLLLLLVVLLLVQQLSSRARFTSDGEVLKLSVVPGLFFEPKNVVILDDDMVDGWRRVAKTRKSWYSVCQAAENESIFS